MAFPASIKARWPDVLAVALTNIVTGYVTLSVASAKLDTRLSFDEQRILKIEETDPQRTKWTADQNSAAILTMQARSEVNAEHIARIDIQLASIQAKLDEALKARQDQTHQ